MSEAPRNYIAVTKTQVLEVKDLGQKVHEARVADSRSLLSICRESGISPNHWYRIERGQINTLPIETLQKIESVLGVDFGITFDD